MSQEGGGTAFVSGLKRKRSTTTAIRSAARRDGYDLARLIVLLRDALAQTDSGDCIRLCGDAPFQVLATRPQHVMDLAREKINTWEYRQVPYCWLRLFEDASLYLAIQMLCDDEDASPEHDGLDEVVKVLDQAVIMTGGRYRSEQFSSIFRHLANAMPNDGESKWPATFSMVPPATLVTECAIPSTDALTFSAFQIHIERQTTPLVIRGVIDHWPALQSWSKPAHLQRLTLGGRRLVPVEIGETYTHREWRQQLMPFREYLEKYLLPQSPDVVGYMGQHDLLSQIPALRHEISIPDYCYTSPSDIVPETLIGQPPSAELLEPQVNAWLGPRGTRSPLHHDPYHNIFCQVTGFKYVRLYPPIDTASIYPRGSDENGISMANTSSVDVKFAPHGERNIAVARSVEFPMFCARGDYQEAILGPGDSLYIPAGWWHYFESLSTSFSVSFWWN